MIKVRSSRFLFDILFSYMTEEVQKFECELAFPGGVPFVDIRSLDGLMVHKASPTVRSPILTAWESALLDSSLGRVALSFPDMWDDLRYYDNLVISANEEVRLQIDDILSGLQIVEHIGISQVDVPLGSKLIVSAESIEVAREKIRNLRKLIHRILDPHRMTIDIVMDPNKLRVCK